MNMPCSNKQVFCQGIKGLTIALVFTFALCCQVFGYNAGEPHAVKLLVARGGDKVTLKWRSEYDYLYTVMYASSRSENAQWKPHPKFIRIEGNNEDIVLTDHVPYGVERVYRLRVEAILRR